MGYRLVCRIYYYGMKWACFYAGFDISTMARLNIDKLAQVPS